MLVYEWVCLYSGACIVPAGPVDPCSLVQFQIQADRTDFRITGEMSLGSEASTGQNPDQQKWK